MQTCQWWWKNSPTVLNLREKAYFQVCIFVQIFCFTFTKKFKKRVKIVKCKIFSVIIPHYTPDMQISSPSPIIPVQHISVLWKMANTSHHADLVIECQRVSKQSNKWIKWGELVAAFTCIIMILLVIVTVLTSN